MKVAIVVSSFAIVALLLVGNASAQVKASANLTVTANNVGVFACTFNVMSFDFGNVDANGTSYNTANVIAGGRNAAGNGGSYNSIPGSITWTCASAPLRVMTVKLASVAADHTLGTMTTDALQAELQTSAGNAGAGLQNFTSRSNLVNGATVGNGSNSATGNLNLRLNVLDTDPRGVNTWILKLETSGI